MGHYLDKIGLALHSSVQKLSLQKQWPQIQVGATIAYLLKGPGKYVCMIFLKICLEISFFFFSERFPFLRKAQSVSIFSY